jgi:hypothetical protein
MKNQIKIFFMSASISLACGATAGNYESTRLPFEKFAYLRINDYFEGNGNFDSAKEGFARCVAVMRHMAESRQTHENKVLEDASPENQAAMGLLQSYVLVLVVDSEKKGIKLKDFKEAAEVFLEREVLPFQEKYANWTTQTNIYPSVFKKPLHPLMIEHQKCMEFGSSFREGIKQK